MSAQLAQMRALLNALGSEIQSEEFAHAFRAHMHTIWLELESAGLITIELRHSHTNLAEALDAFDIQRSPTNIDAVRSRFVLYEAVVPPSAGTEGRTLAGDPEL
jgi:hypothetical protein